MIAHGLRIAIVARAASGGASLAAARLADALRRHTGATVDVIDQAALHPALPDDVAPVASFSNHQLGDVHFSVERPGFRRAGVVAELTRYDVVNLHWIAGVLSVREVADLASAGTPTILSLHDFHHLTGGCHYPGPCRRLASGCYGCPQIDRHRASARLPPVIARARRDILTHPNVLAVTPSAYVRVRAVSDGVVPARRCRVLRNPFAPALALRPSRAGETVRIAVVADHLADRRKNLAMGADALAILRRAQPRFVVDLVGAHGEGLVRQLNEAGVATNTHGRLDAAGTEAVLRLADVVFLPSLEENWPNVLVEGGVYGAAPVVGPGHGAAEFVATFGVGTVASAYGASAFAHALDRAINDLGRGRSDAARRAIAAAHDPARIAARFVALARALGRARRLRLPGGSRAS